MSNLFQSVQTERKKYNNFNLSREVLVSGRIGKLIPVQCDEIVPGDRFKQNAAFFTRFTPLAAPAMARFNVHFHTFFVPFRIITQETGQESTYERLIKSIGKASEDVPVLPYLVGNSSGATKKWFQIGTLADYLGFPVNNGAGVTFFDEYRVSALPFLCYQRIYQDFYRRDQLEQEVMFPVNVEKFSIYETSFSNNDEYEQQDVEKFEANQVAFTKEDLFALRTRNYERDYFTSALPEPQFGDEVTLGDGSLEWLGSNARFGIDTMTLYANPNEEGLATAFSPIFQSYLNFGQGFDYVMNGQYADFPSFEDLSGRLRVMGTLPDNIGDELASHLNYKGFTINEFRLAMQLQGIREKINRVGTRYLEIMQGIYGVTVPDARLQRPIYLGGFKNPVTVGSVMQTSESSKTPQGTLTGQMSAQGANNLVSSGYEFKEHGYLMTIMSITPRTSYYGGMPRKYLKKYPEDFYLPDFDHLGEQTIYKGELYWNNNTAVATNAGKNIEDFGYTPKYSELKSALSSVHGEFRTTLDNWHVSRDFDEAPSLNPDFIKAEPEDFDRLFMFQDIENTSNEHFHMQIYLDVIAKRNMSKYSTPYTLY